MKILVITSEWPDSTHEYWVPFLVNQINSLREMGVIIDVYHFRGKGNPLNYIKAWFDIRRQSSWNEADILHAHWGQSGLLALYSKKKLVVTFHGSDLQGDVNQKGNYTFDGKVLVNISKFIANTADYCLPVSKRIQKLLPKNVRSEVIPCGINFDLFHPMDKDICSENLHLDKNKKYILFIADPKNPIKRYNLAKNAIDLVNKEYYAELLVVNGYDHKQIPIFMNAGDTLILTSTHEGSPTVVKEALACNLPIVSVDVGDIREMTQGIEGCEICEATPASLAEGITKVLDRGIRLEAIEKIQFLDETRIAKRIINVYHQLLEDEKQ